jgi:hypothetical protein
MDVSFLSAVKHSPLFFLLTLMIGAPALPVSLVSVVMMMRKAPIARLIGVVALAGAFVALLVSVAGWFYGCQLAESAATFPGLSAAEQTLLVQQGRAEAGYTIWFGVFIAVPPILFGTLGILGSRPKR